MFKNLVTDTESIEVVKFFSENEIKSLLNFFLSYPANLLKIKTLSEFDQPWIKLSKVNLLPEIKTVFSKIQNYLETDMVCVGDNFYQTPSAYGLHTDAKYGINYKNLLPFKNFLIPLYPDNKEVKFFTFNQRYYGPGASFLSYDVARENLDYNKVVFTPFHTSKLFEGRDKNKISYEWWSKNINLPGIPFEHFDELSIEREFTFTPGSLIIFDSWRLHCGGNFRQFGIDYKIGLSLIGMKKHESVL